MVPLPPGAVYGAGLRTREGNFLWLTGKAVPAQSTQEVATSEDRDEGRLASLALAGAPATAGAPLSLLFNPERGSIPAYILTFTKEHP